MKRKALGKGLSSLIRQAPVPAPPAPTSAAQDSPAPAPARSERPGEAILQLDLDRIRPNQDQPRENFDNEALEDLARSLKHDGVLQPVLVRRVGEDRYELIAGERRWRAAQIAGLLKVPAIVREAADDDRLRLALIENLQREELNPVEEANAFQTLVDELGLTQQEVAERVGKQRATVANALRLLNLPKEVQQRIQDGNVSAGHAKALVALANVPAQKALAKRIADEGLSVRQVEGIVRRAAAPSGVPGSSRSAPRDPNVVAAEESLQSALGTKVKIVAAGKGGRLELHYYSDEELERLYQVVLRGTRP